MTRRRGRPEIMKVLTINHQRTVGWLLAFFFLVGNWSLSRMFDGSESEELFFLELRFISLVGIFIFTGLIKDQNLRHAVTKLRRPRIKVLSLLIYTFLIWAMFATAWAPDIELALDKAFDVLLLFLVVLALQINLGKNNTHELLFGFWTGILVIGSVMAVLALASAGEQFSSSQGNRVSVLGGGPIILGRNMGLMILATFYFQSAVKIRWVNVGPGLVSIAVLGTVAILLTGSRGALLAIFVACAVYFVLDRRSWPKKAVIFVGGFGALLVFLNTTSIGQNVHEMFMSRVVELTFEKRYTSGRGDLWYEALEITRKNPLFGAGLAGFQAAAITVSDAHQSYPHNIFLEVLCETGIVGLLLFLSAGMASIAVLWRNWRFLGIASVAALFLNLILAQSSGQLFDSRGLIIFSYLSLISDRVKARS